MRQFSVSLIQLAIIATIPVASAQTGLPASPRRLVSAVYFGKTVVDNYRWLEDMNSPEVKDCFKAQGDYTTAKLNRIPGRDKLIQTFVNYDKLLAVRYGEIKKRGDIYFYRKTLPAEKAGKLYRRQGKTGSETLLFGPITYDPDSDPDLFSIAKNLFTEDKAVTFRKFANMFAFGLRQAGHPDFQPGARQPNETAKK